MTNSRTIDNSQDILDVWDIIERFEELEEFFTEDEAGASEAPEFFKRDEFLALQFLLLYLKGNGGSEEDREEFALLSSLLSDLKGNGGDEQWRGDWYPITLIRDSYFVDAMKELCEDIGDIPKNIPEYFVIDWEATAENLRVDYSSVEFDGVTYWYR